MASPPSQPFHQGPLQTLQCLWSYLPPEDRRALRATSRETCAAATCLIDRLHVSDITSPKDAREAAPQSPRDVSATVQRFLARGGRPRCLVIRLNARRTLEERTSIGLGILAALSTVPHGARPLEELELQGLPLGPEICAQLAAAAPRPTRIKLRGYDLSGAGEAAPCAAAAAAFLRAAAPSLKRLSMERFAGPPEWAPALVAALRQCRGLEALTLRVGRLPDDGLGFSWPEYGLPQAVPLLEAAAAAPNLTTLKLRVKAEGDSHVDKLDAASGRPDHETEVYAAHLRRLSGLTRLVLERAVPAAVLPALPHLPHLTVLEVPEVELTPSVVRALSAAPCLTHLRARCVDPCDAGAPLAVRVRQSRPRPGSLRLPPRLQSLELTESMSPHMLFALQLPACCTRLLIPGLVVLENEDDTEPVYNPERMDEYRAAAAAVLRACAFLADHGFDGAALRAPFLVRGMNLAVNLVDGEDGEDGEEDQWVQAVPGGFEALAAALGRLRLRGLDLESKDIDFDCMAALVPQLPDLEELELSWVEAGIAQLLRPLSRLRSLTLHFRSVCSGTGEQLATELLDLLDAVPALRRVRMDIFCIPDSDPEAVYGAQDSLWEAMKRVRSALRGRGRDPGIVELDGYASDGEEWQERGEGGGNGDDSADGVGSACVDAGVLP